MLSREQADRIATAIRVVRPDWNHPQLMGVLGMEAIKDRRAYTDTFHAMLAIALDPATDQPTRVLEAGPWWSAGPRGSKLNMTDLLPTHADDDCRECGQPATHPSHFDDSDRGCKYLSPSAWAERARAADHHAKAADIRARLSPPTADTEETTMPRIIDAVTGQDITEQHNVSCLSGLILTNALRSRGLPVSGTKMQQARRLVAAGLTCEQVREFDWPADTEEQG